MDALFLNSYKLLINHRQSHNQDFNERLFTIHQLDIIRSKIVVQHDYFDDYYC